ncbi:MAG: TlpA family protein disulfide reductase [Planctomycetia bacterium]|nr:TlpA family protein disulfide reductase [Planctomycetia bacterium]
MPRQTLSIRIAAGFMAVALLGPTTMSAELAVGSKAPLIEIEHWIQTREGAFKPITEFAPGKVYVIEFWATCCGPCVASMPHLARLQDDYADKGVTIISVSDEDVDTIRQFLDQPADEPGGKTYREITKGYCLTTDPDGSAGKAYMEASGEGGIPTAFLVGKTGKIEWIGHPAELDEPLELVVAGRFDPAAYAKEVERRRATVQKALEPLQPELEKLGPLLVAGKFSDAIEMLDGLIVKTAEPEARKVLEGFRGQIVASAKTKQQDP